MRNHIVEIGDKHGRAFKVQISTPTTPGQVVSNLAHMDMGTFELLPGGVHRISGNYPTGTWRSIDKGFITEHNGRVVPARSHDGSGRTTEDIYLESALKAWGVKLFDYQDIWGVNDQGTGFVGQYWALGFDVGKFEWALVD
jgi:hypothetical protein